MSENSFTPDTPLENQADAPIQSEASQPSAPNSEATIALVASKLSVPPEQAGISLDQRAYQQYQTLAQVVLDSADLATKSAEAAVNVGHQLRQATAEFKELTDDGHKKARILLAASGGLMLVCLIFFLIMGVRMVSRINQLDTMLMAVGKRVVDLNAGMESLEGVNKSVQELASQQSALTKSQGDIEGRIDASLKQSESLVQKVPTETAKQVAASSDSVIKQVQGISSRMQAQSNAVQALGNEVKALKGAVGNVDGLKRDVEALVTLQKERYLEALQKNSANNTSRERNLQFPRYAAPKPAEGAATPVTPTTAAPAQTAVKP
jgi:methyl-accepting chemotaxis protein